MTPRLLVADSEGTDARAERRANVGQSAGEAFGEFLGKLSPGAAVELATPADPDAPMPTREELARFDAVFLTGSPLHIYDGSAEAEREIAFMRAVFSSGTPSFGSCAGLQVAVAAAGGAVRPASHREAGLGRRITATEAGRTHPLRLGRPPVWDALTIHGDEVETLPAGATLLATSARCRVQAVEIRHDAGVFWGVQYHPELTPHEIAAALRRDADDLVEAGLARERSSVEIQADLFDALDREPNREDLRWSLGVDEQVAQPDHRQREVRNFLDHLVGPNAKGG